MTKRPLNRFIIPNFHKHLRAHHLSPQDFSRAAGLSLMNVKALRQHRPTTKAAAQKALAFLHALGDDKARIEELTPQDLSQLHLRRKTRKSARQAH
ncbi:MAG: hypothetical protein AAF198_11720 [Pseudomonadota bacterium]